MSFGFNSKFQDTAGKRNQLYNSVSNIFELSEKDGNESIITDKAKQISNKNTTKNLIKEIQIDTLRFHDEKGSDKLKYFCKFFYIFT